MVAGTSYTHHSQLFSKKSLWKEMLQNSQKVAKYPNENFGANCFSKEPNLWFLAPKEPTWQPWFTKVSQG